MSDADDDDARTPSTVGRARGGHTVPEMNVVGYVVAAVLLVVVIPFVPLVLAYLALVRIARAIRPPG